MGKIGMSAAIAALAGGALWTLAEDAAAHEYPYCAMRGGRGSSETCGYASLVQCRATVVGAGGYCQPNPRFVALYGAPDAYAPPRRHLRRY